jgi:hypothetical protein
MNDSRKDVHRAREDGSAKVNNLPRIYSRDVYLCEDRHVSVAVIGELE